MDCQLQASKSASSQSRRCSRSHPSVTRLALVLFILSIALCSPSPAQNFELSNNHVLVTFGPKGLKSIADRSSNNVAHFKSDEFSFSVDQDEIDSSSLVPEVVRSAGQITYIYKSHGYTFDVVYEIGAAWHFVTKQIRIAAAPSSNYLVHRVEPLRTTMQQRVVSAFTPGTYLPQFGARQEHGSDEHPTHEFGTFLRFSQTQGLMLLIQNPFLTAKRTGETVSLNYAPEMQWQSTWSPFLSDIACIGTYKLSGNRIPARMILEWQVPPGAFLGDGADRAEIEAFTDCVRQFLIHPPPKPISVEIGWTLNDYQIDVATQEGRAEYKRVLDTTADLGIEALLYAPANYQLAQIDHDADDWNWEHVLWLGLGQQIREGKWNPEKSPLPASVTEMLDYAKAKHVGLLAYVYPSLPFSQDSGWLVTDSRKSAKKSYATLASRDFQDFLIRELQSFKRRTGVAGYSFDYAFLNLPGSSPYSQWWGWRRVLEALRQSEPEIVIDGRQTYQMFGPWSWLAGSYPHPTGNDEQPESFTPYPDLHFDRVSADRARFVNYWYRNYQFAPEEVIPGYITHQTERSINLPSDTGSRAQAEREKLVYTSYRARDWDYLAYRYSELASIATAGWNNVMDMVPARDLAEFEHFSKDDKAWIRRWLEWAAANKEYLRRTRTILGQPAINKVDGTSAILGDRGFLFLFNPNYKQLTADFRLDETIGLNEANNFLLREIYPHEGKLVGKPGSGVWNYGDQIHLPLDGTSATVFELAPAGTALKQPIVFGSNGTDSRAQQLVRATLDDKALDVKHATGAFGTQEEIGVLLPNDVRVDKVTLNGKAMGFAQKGRYVTFQVQFAGKRFAHSEQVKLETAENASLSGSFVVPARVLQQLAARQKKWPIPWMREDYDTTWLVPERLLLFVQIAEPKDTMEPLMTLDGHPLQLTKAYSSVRVHKASFVGFYADLTNIQAEVKHEIRLKLPPLTPGQFQGVFFDNVETEDTQELAP